ELEGGCKECGKSGPVAARCRVGRVFETHRECPTLAGGSREYARPTLQLLRFVSPRRGRGGRVKRIGPECSYSPRLAQYAFQFGPSERVRGVCPVRNETYLTPVWTGPPRGRSADW